MSSADELLFDKEKFKQEVKNNVKGLYRKKLSEATDQEVFQAVSYTVKDVIIDHWLATQETFDEKDPKMVFYMSMEFLMGRALGNNLINLTAYSQVKEALDELGFDLNVIEDQEPDPALGNGGLGRLAACFMDSLATLGYAAYGCGIRYHYGMFRQKIENGEQVEKPDNWLKDGYPFELRRPEHTFIVKFGGYIRSEALDNGKTRFIHENYQAIRAVPYDMPIVGYNNNMVNTLIMWDAEATNEFELDSFDRGDYRQAVEEENLARTLVDALYPNDNHMQGKELRLRQQYFFVSASVQRAVARYKKYHPDINKLFEKGGCLMIDPHPTFAVAELMRILMDEEGLGWEEAWNVTSKSCAYTNHTIMSEALEKWPIELFSRLLPRIYQIVEEINRRLMEHIEDKFPGAQDRKDRMAIIHAGQVRMANLAITVGFSVNGVARLHTQILETRELKDFYELYPEKFNNKTNGITQRRFLYHANPLLAAWVTDKVGDEWVTDLTQTKRLSVYLDDPKAQQEFMNIKYKNKMRLAHYILENTGVEVDPRSIFDVQTKRIHEYKRQLLNVLHIMYLYNQIKEHPDLDIYPRTFIFGAKAAAGYEIAKMTIKLINSVADVINNDKSIDGKIRVVFIEDYKVSNAEIIFAGADVSEQISTASKEASGTGYMKVLLICAVSSGTLFGAIVEMAEEVGEENMFIFGMSADEVIEHERVRDYNPMDVFNNDQDIRQVLMQLVNGKYSPDNPERFRKIYNSLLNTNDTQYADTYFCLKDFRSYVDAQKRVEEAYRDETRWAKMAMSQVACVGKSSSDRTIQEYVDDIWHLTPITVDVVDD